MVASRWPLRPGLARAVSIRRLISSPVRYSRGRTAALVGRRGVTVRFSMVGPFLPLTRKALYLIGVVYVTVRIWAKKLSAAWDLNCRAPWNGPNGAKRWYSRSRVRCCFAVTGGIHLISYKRLIILV